MAVATASLPNMMAGPSSLRAPLWQPQHMNDAPEPPPVDNREAELAALAAQEKLGHDGKRQRVRPRRTVDIYGGLERWKILKTFMSSKDDIPGMRPNPSYVIDLLPPAAYKASPATSFCSRYSHTSTNKIRCPVNIVKWTPDARRVLTGSTSGEFTLWNGLTFNFETILQAHDTAVRAMEWSNGGQWLVSGDNSGMLKYFQGNMNNLQVFRGHKESIRDISFAPNDARFVTGSDDGTLKIWNFEEMREEKTLTGHGWDVRCVKWHPTKGLLVSGSKDNLVKFWDPRTSQVLTTLHGHKNTIQALAWSPNGNLVATASRDQLAKVFDIRAMKELVTLRGHTDEVCSVAWHPVHEDLLVTGGSEGSIIHWSMPDSQPKDMLPYAHDSNVWSLAFHPMGHLLVSASNDHMTRFWSRSRPGTHTSQDRYHVGKDKARELGTANDDDEDDFVVPGLGGNRGGPGGRGGFDQGGIPGMGMGGGGGGGGGIPGMGGPQGIPGMGGPPGASIPGFGGGSGNGGGGGPPPGFRPPMNGFGGQGGPMNGGPPGNGGFNSREGTPQYGQQRGQYDQQQRHDGGGRPPLPQRDGGFGGPGGPGGPGGFGGPPPRDYGNNQYGGPPQGGFQGGPPQGGYQQGGPPPGFNQGGPPPGFNQGGPPGRPNNGPPQGFGQPPMGQQRDYEGGRFRGPPNGQQGGPPNGNGNNWGQRRGPY